MHGGTLTPDLDVQRGYASQPGTPPDAGIRRQRYTRRAGRADPAPTDRPGTNSGPDASETRQDQTGNAALDYASSGLPGQDPLPNPCERAAQATQPREIVDSSTLGTVTVEPLHRLGNILPNPDDTTSSMSEDDLFTAIWDTQLFSLPWAHRFDLSTTAFSAIHIVQPLWPISADFQPSGSQCLFNPHLRQSKNSQSIAEDLGRRLPSSTSAGSPKSLQHGQPPIVSIFDRIFSHRTLSEPERLPPAYPVARRSLSKTPEEVRVRLKTQLKLFHHLLPKAFVLPSQHALNRYTSAYFNGFHLHLPFIHVPTWSPASCHLGLFIAICSLGAKYCLEQQTAIALWDAGRLIVRAATEEKNEDLDVANSGHIEICQAMLLLMVFQTWSGNSFGLRQALSSQSALASVSNIAYLKPCSHR